MARTITCTKAARVAGRIELHFDGARTLDFADVSEIGQFVDDAFDNNESLLQALLIRYCRKNTANQAAFLAMMAAKKITLDFDQINGNILKVTNV